MNSLHLLADVTHVLPFHLYDDVKRQPTRCELVVHPGQGWAVASELPQTLQQPALIGLVQCHITLAAKICQEYNIEPGLLTLFTRYAYSDNYENVYAVRFGHGERDLFDGIRFVEPRRDMLNQEDVTALVEQLSSGQAPAQGWRALTPAPASKATASTGKVK
jgi:hypothetical protein